MNFKNITVARYSLISIGLHWLMVLQLTAVYACIELRDLFPKGSEPYSRLSQISTACGIRYTTASALEEQDAIPAVKAQMLLIQALAGDD